MPAELGPTTCGHCRMVLDESPHTGAKDRAACPSCGSLAGQFSIVVSGDLELHSRLDYKARAPGRRPFVEDKIGADLHKKSGTWMRLTRVIDRVRNWYSERVVNSRTGEVVRECEGTAVRPSWPRRGPPSRCEERVIPG
jgi:hypothetical protein